jgi:hypothetical protein
MWLWGVRVTSMENTIKDLTCFEDYRNRQVILNYYHEEDFLWKREGYHFISIKVEPTQFIFQQEQGIVTIPVEDYPTVTRNNDFQNYYIFSEPKLDVRLEMYFP